MVSARTRTAVGERLSLYLFIPLSVFVYLFINLLYLSVRQPCLCGWAASREGSSSFRRAFCACAAFGLALASAICARVAGEGDASWASESVLSWARVFERQHFAFALSTYEQAKLEGGFALADHWLAARAAPPSSPACARGLLWRSRRGSLSKGAALATPARIGQQPAGAYAKEPVGPVVSV